MKEITSNPLVSLLQNSSDAIIVIAPLPWRLVFANRELLDWLNQNEIEKSSKLPTIDAVFGSTWSDHVASRFEQVLAGNSEQIAFVLNLRIGAADEVQVEVRLSRLEVAGSPLVGVVLHRMAEVDNDAIRRVERRDPLTDLPDRSFLLARLATLLGGDRQADREFAVLFLDLNNFKHINDRHGHLLGDRVLREVAQRLQHCVREGDHVTRYGGDEFVLLLEGVSNWDAVEAVVMRIRSELAQPIRLPEGTFQLSLSIGLAKAEPHHQSPEDVLRDADLAMYAAKHADA